MIDPVDLVLLCAAQDCGVQRLGGLLVVAERLFDHHVAPVLGFLAILIPVFLEQPCLAEVSDHRTEKSVGGGQIEQTVPLGTGRLVQMLLQFSIQAVVVQVAFYISDVTGQTLPGVLIDFVDPAFAGCVANETLHHLVQAVAPRVGVQVSEVDTDEFEVFR